jgi:subtilisin family serine protease
MTCEGAEMLVRLATLREPSDARPAMPPAPSGAASPLARFVRGTLAAAAAVVLGAALVGPAEAGPRRGPAAGRRTKANPWVFSEEYYFDGAFYRGAGAIFPASATLAAGTTSATVPVSPFEPAIIHVDAPAGSVVRIELRRLNASPVRLAGVTDSDGRFFDPFAERRTASRVTFEPVPVLGDGGIDLAIEAAGLRPALAQVSVTIETGAPPGGGFLGDYSNLAWEPGQFVVAYADSGYTAQEIADLLGAVLLDDHGDFAVFAIDARHYGSEWYGLDEYGNAVGNDPSIVFEVDATAEPPEGSQRNFIIVGSDFGRIFLRQPAFKMIRHTPGRVPLNGAGTTIAIVDTGVDETHPFLTGKVLAGWDFVDDDADTREETYDEDRDGDGHVNEAFGHGTLVASVALAIAPQAKILPVRVLDPDGRGTASGVAAGVRFAAESGADVINLSLGTRAPSAVLQNAVEYAQSLGCVVVVASGNDGDPFVVDFPGSLPGVISVSALDAKGRKPAWSNGRRTATIYAPGAGVIGAYPGGIWGSGRGTSFSAPLVTGAAALVIQSGLSTREAEDVASRISSPGLRRLDLRPLYQSVSPVPSAAAPPAAAVKAAMRAATSAHDIQEELPSLPDLPTVPR